MDFRTTNPVYRLHNRLNPKELQSYFRFVSFHPLPQHPKTVYVIRKGSQECTPDSRTADYTTDSTPKG